MLNPLLIEVNTLFSVERVSSIKCISSRLNRLIFHADTVALESIIWRFRAPVLASFIEKQNKVNESVKISACAFYYC